MNRELPQWNYEWSETLSNAFPSKFQNMLTVYIFTSVTAGSKVTPIYLGFLCMLHCCSYFACLFTSCFQKGTHNFVYCCMFFYQILDGIIWIHVNAWHYMFTMSVTCFERHMFSLNSHYYYENKYSAFRGTKCILGFDIKVTMKPKLSRLFFIC